MSQVHYLFEYCGSSYDPFSAHRRPSPTDVAESWRIQMGWTLYRAMTFNPHPNPMSRVLVSSLSSALEVGSRELYHAVRRYLVGAARREASHVQPPFSPPVPDLPLRGTNGKDHEKDEGEPTSRTQADPLPQKPPRRAILYMVAFFVVAAALMTAHHFFYAFLSGRPATNYSLLSTFRLPFTITNQSLVNAISNGLAIVIQNCLVAVVGCAFAQAFWWRMPHTQSQDDPGFKKISDEVLSFHDNPLNVKTWPVLIHMPSLAVISICGSLLAATNIATPGALTVTTDAFGEACHVPSVNLSLVNFTTPTLLQATTQGPTAASPNAQALSLVTRVLLAGTYFAPPSPCGMCQYNVSFAAPAVQCTNTTQTTNFLEWLPDGLGTGEDLVWNATFDLADPYLRIASRDEVLAFDDTVLLPGDQLPVVALQCAAYNATYHVSIEQNVTTSMFVSQIDFGAQLDPSSSLFNPSSAPTNSSNQDKSIYEISALWNALGTQLAGTVRYSRQQDGFTPGSSWIAWSAINGAAQSGAGAALAWRWAGDLAAVVPEVMQNVSLSLIAWQQAQNAAPAPSTPHASSSTAPLHNATSILGGAALAGWQATGATQDTTCRVSRLRYTYDRTRLLATYAATLGLTALCLVCGAAGVWVMGVSESLDFSRIATWGRGGGQARGA